ncbi:hypothetical protein EV424DRAFT_1353630 [Suillus variegatus]|nr:hypothetical protein EV424DRAFT_1353630 [Suillus variegatus]
MPHLFLSRALPSVVQTIQSSPTPTSAAESQGNPSHPDFKRVEAGKGLGGKWGFNILHNHIFCHCLKLVTPDEVIHLAAGLQFSGFKSIIGTVWQVDNSVAKHVVKAFYENMFPDLKDGGVMDCTKAAWALNRATHAVETKVPLEQRMVFIHIGV